jgi:hypothetical protein
MAGQAGRYRIRPVRTSADLGRLSLSALILLALLALFVELAGHMCSDFDRGW